MTHDRKYGFVLCGVGDIAGRFQCLGQQRDAQRHADLVAQRDEGVLESVVAHACDPLAILHAVGDDGVDGRVESRKEEL